MTIDDNDYEDSVWGDDLNNDPDAEDPSEEAEEASEETSTDPYQELFDELAKIILTEDNSVELKAWLIGEKLRKTLAIIINHQQAKKAFARLQQNIANQFGSIYTAEKLYECLKIADGFPDLSLFADICFDLSIDHLRLILPLESDLERTYYCELARQEKWTPSVLAQHIQNNHFATHFPQ